ncbi:MAG TPA: hypothetical protein VFP22_06255 [Candidatus Limnocylindrales bacterium]|nr:hypothetical protein [Candidatus Limnocylindrales bacterium]
MVRENPEQPGGSGVDANKNVSLEKELKDAGKWQGETVDPEQTMNTRPIDIRGDAEPEKKG